MELANFMVAVIILVVSVFAAYFSKKSWESGSQPRIVMECNGTYLILRNAGSGIAKSISCEGDKNINIPNKNKVDMLLPLQGSSSDLNVYGKALLTALFSFGLVGGVSNTIIIIKYENLSGKKFESKIQLTKIGEHQYKINNLELPK